MKSVEGGQQTEVKKLHWEDIRHEEESFVEKYTGKAKQAARLFLLVSGLSFGVGCSDKRIQETAGVEVGEKIARFEKQKPGTDLAYFEELAQLNDRPELLHLINLFPKKYVHLMMLIENIDKFQENIPEDQRYTESEVRLLMNELKDPPWTLVGKDSQGKDEYTMREKWLQKMTDEDDKIEKLLVSNPKQWLKAAKDLERDFYEYIDHTKGNGDGVLDAHELSEAIASSLLNERFRPIHLETLNAIRAVEKQEQKHE